MASRASQVINQLVLAISAVNGSDGYTYDLSGTGQIVVGEGIPRDGTDTMVALTAAELSSPDDPVLGAYTRRLSVPFIARTPTADATPGSRLRAALDLADDIAEALEADRSLNGLVLDLRVEVESVDGDEFGASGMAFVVGLITCYWQANSGVGL